MENQNDIISQQVQSLTTPIQTKNLSGSYKDKVRQCCYSMLQAGVAVHQVSPCIKTVENILCDREVLELPQKSTVANMMREAGKVSHIQAGSEILRSSDVTLQSDGTTKFGRHYGSVQVSTGHKTLSLGFRNVFSGSAENYFTGIKEILGKVESCLLHILM